MPYNHLLDPFDNPGQTMHPPNFTSNKIDVLRKPESSRVRMQTRGHCLISLLLSLFGTGSHFLSQTGLKLFTLSPSLSAGIPGVPGVCHHARLLLYLSICASKTPLVKKFLLIFFKDRVDL